MPGSEEQDAAAALALLQSHLAGECLIVVPALLFYELGNILVWGRARPPLAAIEQELSRVHELALEVDATSPSGTQRAARLARELEISFYDATYLALAESLGSDLVTADRRLAKRAIRAGRVHLLGARR